MANIYNESGTASASDAAYGTLSAFFDSRSDAESAISRLKSAGIAENKIRFMPGYEDDNAGGVASNERHGFFDALTDWFFPADDRATYAEGLRRGGYLVSVSGIAEAEYQTAHDILDDEGSIDLDERADQWRTEGWNPAAPESKIGQAASSVATELGLTSAGSTSGRNNAAGGDTRDETIPVVEENLRVGKRDVNNGSVKVRAYTVETPVSENLSLRDENVSIDRRPVDGPLTDADSAFQDRTISAEEHHEEAVISKEARVVEEIGIRKTAADRTETVNDTIRKTEVEIEDERSRSPNPNVSDQASGSRRG